MYILKFYSIAYKLRQNTKKVLLDKINGINNALFFLSRAPTDHNFTFNLRFFGIFHFDSVLILLKFTFSFNKMHELFDFKTS